MPDRTPREAASDTRASAPASAEASDHLEPVVLSGEFLREIVDALATNIAVLDASTRILFVNESWRAFGAARGGGSTLGRSYLEVCRAADGDGDGDGIALAVGNALEELVAGSQEPFSTTYEMHFGDGSTHWDLTLTPIATDHGLRILAAHVDRTREWRATVRLAERERLYSAVFEQSFQATWVLDSSARVLAANRAALELLGRTAEEAAGLDFRGPAWRSVSLDVERLLGDAIASALASRVERLEIEVQSPTTGALGVLDLSVKSVRDAAGSILFLVPEASDITARKQTELALELARRDAESASRAKSAFLAGASHEIRTPLHAILGFTRLAIQASDLPPGVGRDLGLVESSASRLLALVDDILALSEGETRPPTATARAVVVADLFAELERRFQPTIEHRGLTWSLKIGGSVPRGLAFDVESVRQILRALLHYAVRGSSSGEIGVRVAFEPATGGGGRLVVRVLATTMQLDEEELSRLFDPFVLRRVRARQEAEETGLELAIAHGLTRLIGGEIEATSAPDSGTQVRVELPVADVTFGVGSALPASPAVERSSIPKPAPIVRTSSPLPRDPLPLARLATAVDAADHAAIEQEIAALEASRAIDERAAARLDAALAVFDYGELRAEIAKLADG